MNDLRHLGATGLEVSALGVGVWAWGDKGFWQYGTDYGQADVEAAYRASLEAGINFFDTAEMYGRGASETILGECVKKENKPVVIATKFAPLPTRLSAKALWPALEASMMRLGVTQVDLYQIHWPYSFIKVES